MLWSVLIKIEYGVKSIIIVTIKIKVKEKISIKQ